MFVIIIRHMYHIIFLIVAQGPAQIAPRFYELVIDANSFVTKPYACNSVHNRVTLKHARRHFRCNVQIAARLLRDAHAQAPALTPAGPRVFGTHVRPVSDPPIHRAAGDHVCSPSSVRGLGASLRGGAARLNLTCPRHFPPKVQVPPQPAWQECPPRVGAGAGRARPSPRLPGCVSEGRLAAFRLPPPLSRVGASAHFPRVSASDAGTQEAMAPPCSSRLLPQ